MIKILSNHVINQIAAGEVVENPASVVKELVENALDAGASHIVVEIKAGGLQLIRVSDNGCGMNKEDALLSLERHATSKIVHIDDLFALQTMGFRGEALASIAAISKMHLLTSEDEKEAVAIEVEGGKILNIFSGARRRGTTIEVRSLFYNVPARKKFQKSVAASSAEISKILTLLSLAYPEAAFELIQQERPLLTAAAIDKEERLGERVRQVLGEPFFSFMKNVFFEEGAVAIKGYLGVPSYTRHNRMGQYLFVNKRSVISPAISYAVKEGYETRIEAQRYPCFVLHLTIPASFVDVNVHPQKKEVRFQEEMTMKQWIRKAVRICFEEGEKQLAKAFSFEEPRASFQFGKGFEDLPSIAENLSWGPSSFLFKEAPSSFIPRAKEEASLFEKKDLPLGICPIGLFSTYLMVDAESMGYKGGIVIVDLIAALSRVTHEALLRCRDDGREGQILMFPLTLHFSQSEAGALESTFPELEKMGFGIRSAGGSSFVVDAIPSCIKEGDVEEFLRGMLAQDVTNGTLRIARARKTSFVLQEAIKLFEELLRCADSKYCPRGQPTWVHVSLYDIERYFKTEN